MMRAWLVTTILLLAACGQSQNMTRAENEKLSVYDVAEPSAMKASPPGEVAASAPRGPQIAYTYALGYTLDDTAIAPAQARAVALCVRLGQRRCLVAKSDLTRNPDVGGSGSLSVLIDARLAARFGTELDQIAKAAGGEAAERHVEAEDVTKQIVDTDARVRAKQALADRLLAIIRTSSGRVGDLVAAEKSYAEVQEELDAARSLQAELRQRVAMSRIDVTYGSVRSEGTWAPVSRAFDGLTGSFASSIGAAITFVVVAIPWALLVAGLIWLLRRIGWRPRWPWRRRVTVEPILPA